MPTFEEVYIDHDEEIVLIRRILIQLYLWVTNTNTTTKQNLLDVIDEYHAVLQAAVVED
ncbi:MAG: hypothetical protein GQ524_07605 [Anaerolineales bacterium]|nr:hypothetical protein [Anaerolineales bacterium]